LAEWAQTGMLQQADDEGDAAKSKVSNASKSAGRSKVFAGNRVVELDYGTPIVRKTLEPLFRKAPANKKMDVLINVQRTDNGFALALDSKLVAANVGLDEIGEVVSHELFKQAVKGENEVALAGTWVPVSENEADFFLTRAESDKDGALPLLYSAKQKNGISGGAILNLKTGALAPIGLPIRIDDTSTDDVEPLKALAAPGTIQNRRVGGRGRLLASNYEGDGKGYSLRRLYLENPEPDVGDTQPTSDTASHHAALAALLAATIGKNGDFPSGIQIQKMNDWLNDVEARTAKGSNSVATAKLLLS